MLASRGRREIEYGSVPVADAGVRRALQFKARRVWIKTVLATAATGAILVLLR